jgi:hypothetical protein
MTTNCLLSNLSIYFILVLTACKGQPSANEEALRRINIYSSASIKFIDREIENAIDMQQWRLENPISAYKAGLWQPKFISIQKHCDEMVMELKTFRKTANLSGELMNERINEFKAKLLEVDGLINKEFNKEISYFPEVDSAQAASDRFLKYEIESASPLATEAYVNALMERVKILEHTLLRFCLEQTVTDSFHFDSFSAIIGQSSSRVAAGERIEIIAGVGAFSRRARPVITIGQKDVPLSNDAAAHYYFNAPRKKGKYIVSAKITFYDEMNKVQTIEKDIEYRVVGN